MPTSGCDAIASAQLIATENHRALPSGGPKDSTGAQTKEAVALPSVTPIRAARNESKVFDASKASAISPRRSRDRRDCVVGRSVIFDASNVRFDEIVDRMNLDGAGGPKRRVTRFLAARDRTGVASPPPCRLRASLLRRPPAFRPRAHGEVPHEGGGLLDLLREHRIVVTLDHQHRFDVVSSRRDCFVACRDDALKPMPRAELSTRNADRSALDNCRDTAPLHPLGSDVRTAPISR